MFNSQREGLISTSDKMLLSQLTSAALTGCGYNSDPPFRHSLISFALVSNAKILRNPLIFFIRSLKCNVNNLTFFFVKLQNYLGKYRLLITVSVEYFFIQFGQKIFDNYLNGLLILATAKYALHTQCLLKLDCV